MSSDHSQAIQGHASEINLNPQVKSVDPHHKDARSTSRGSKDTNDLPQHHISEGRPSPQARAVTASSLPSPAAKPLVLDPHDHKETNAATTILSGTSLFPFHIDTNTLMSESPYFANLAVFNEESTNHHPELKNPYAKKLDSNPIKGPFSYPEFDEFAVALFAHWVQDEHTLRGPHDFHTLNHYLCLYALARRFGMERLQNQVMDTIRHYYHQEHMTAPPFRLDYIYAHTSGPNKMKHFLVATAAYRVLSRGLDESDNVGYDFPNTEPVSDSLKDVLRGGGDVALDFVDKLVALARSDMEDPRRGDDCQWHEHTEGPFGTPKCGKWGGFEAYESH